ncbi:hypothetical protein GPECTOR_1g430 [Gonium pectorale]|uniref:ARID domain-containing protein n=1 Tax=Gonium pectorale TaxID=33097 RepID=A0A150H329_GONPE|nr:hypothetical protein GPECTOR_1g430 [Gonium pectorale]|eukprot:KXZ56481.1 hypothetical protein GPECTOR_1g430 [Gonium pectorale]
MNDVVGAGGTLDSGVGPTSATCGLRESKSVTVLHNPTLEEFRSAVDASRPNFVYCAGPTTPSRAEQHQHQQPAVVGTFLFRDQQPQGSDEELLGALASVGAELVYVDAVVPPNFGPALHIRGTSHVVVWPASVVASASAPIPAAVAAHFNATFLSFLTGAAASPPEAFAAASHSAQAHCSAAAAGGGGPSSRPPLPALVSGVRPALPDSGSIPPPELPQGIQLDASGLPSFPGWSDVRLLAPRAELRLLLVGGCGLLDAGRLGCLGEGLRALLVMEARGLTLASCTPLPLPPRNAPPGCAAARCGFVSSSGAGGCVVLCAPPAVLERQALVQHALRMSLVADSVSLQFRLPPPGLSLPPPRSSPAVAGGLAVVDAVAATSVWAVELLRSLCKDPRSHALAALGVAAVGSAADSAFTPAAVQRFARLLPGAGAPEGRGRPAGPLSDQPPRFRGELPGYVCRRPPLSSCSEAAFYDDLVDFLTRLRGRPVDRSRFPEAVLNGVPLDLFALYREVVSRGGFRVGNGINWKGQVFPRMRNWTESNKQTGVGNALKRHYQNYLWEYEAAHPEDVTLDRCVLCNGGDGAASDWVACDACENWAHLSCDRRQGLGTFKEYAAVGGRVYVCPACAREREAGAAGEAGKRQRVA